MPVAREEVHAMLIEAIPYNFLLILLFKNISKI